MTDTMIREREPMVQPNVRERRGVPIAAIAALAGAAAIVTGTLLPWITAPGGRIGFEGGAVGDAATGLDFALGIATLALGAVAVVAGLLWLVRRRAGAFERLVMVVAGLAAIACAAYFLVDVEARFIDFAVGQVASDEVPAATVRDLLQRAFDGAIVGVDPGIGLWVTLGGGGVLLLAGLASLARRRRTAAA